MRFLNGKVSRVHSVENIVICLVSNGRNQMICDGVGGVGGDTDRMGVLDSGGIESCGGVEENKLAGSCADYLRVVDY